LSHSINGRDTPNGPKEKMNVNMLPYQHICFQIHNNHHYNSHKEDCSPAPATDPQTDDDDDQIGMKESEGGND
jgi:hypothetical protein